MGVNALETHTGDDVPGVIRRGEGERDERRPWREWHSQSTDITDRHLHVPMTTRLRSVAPDLSLRGWKTWVKACAMLNMVRVL